MSEYVAPIKDMSFVMNHIAGLAELSALEEFEHADSASVDHILAEASKFVAEVLSPLNQSGDVEGSTFHDGEVTTPKGFKAAYKKLCDSGWAAMPFEEEYGGGGMPWLVTCAVQEMLVSGNCSLSMIPGLTQAAIEAVASHGSDEQKGTYLANLVSGKWTGTMNLTEPDAGSEVGAVVTRALPADDGTWRIKGTKIFISFGEHDCAENIIHLVLARTPGAPAGTKGISCFLVPKFLINDDGSLGARNDVKCVSIEHKMGIKASPTCALAYGDDTEGAIGYLLGEENQGMRYMFTMMNSARIAVGLMGVAVGQRAYQAALEYAQERTQGRAIGGPADQRVKIIEHPDVRRMLMLMKSQVEAMRALAYYNAAAIDFSEHHPDPEERKRQKWLAELLTPVTKAWCSDVGCEVASLAIQVYGGMGFIEETGIPQYYRDLRIAPIYEGTNGIQALDLIGRKLPMDGGKPILNLIQWMRSICLDLDGVNETCDHVRNRLVEGIDTLERSTFWLFENGMKDPASAAAGATQYLTLFGRVIGGALLAQEALVAQRLLNDGKGDKAFLEAKLVTARFYADQVLSQAPNMFAQVSAGKDDLYAIDPAHLFE